MMPFNSLVTLDQLEDVEYLFRVISNILPSLCLDYKICPKLKTTYVHPFDILLHSDCGKPADIEQVQSSIEKIGINYLLDLFSNPKLFNYVVHPGFVDIIQYYSKIKTSHNTIHNTRSFNDLPPFTKELMFTRLTEPEYVARFIGGYVKSDDDSLDLFPEKHPDLNFENTYMLNLIYKDVIDSGNYGFRTRITNGVMFKRDFDNLMEIRKLLTVQSRDIFDRTFQLAKAATDYNVQLPQLVPNTDILLMPSFKPLLMYYQYFNTQYTLDSIYYNADKILTSNPSIPSIVASMRFQSVLPKLLKLYPDLPVRQDAVLTLQDSTTMAVHVINVQIGGTFVDISSQTSYFITLLNMLAKEERSTPIKKQHSLFWDGISYDEYKSKKITDIVMYNSTCYVMGLYNKNNITYCSMLSDIILANETPIRVCFLPRVIAGKTVPALISEILDNVNNISHKDFPKKTRSSLMHIGLSENNFMKFFQLIRLTANKQPEVAIKEILMSYIGFKLNDTGSPYYIKRESYQDFCLLLFTAMGFKVSVKKSIIGSDNHTIISIKPKVTKQYIHHMLVKSSCCKEDANKIISAAYDLLNFMVSVGDYKNYQTYCFTKNLFPNYFYFGGVKENDFSAGSVSDNIDDIQETIIHLTEPINILDRINVRGIFSATTVNEMLDVDAFGPENTAFKNNLSQLINSGNLSGNTVVQALPFNILDKIVTIAGGPCTVSFSELIDGIGEDEDDEECNDTHKVLSIINTALKDNLLKTNTAMVAQTMNSVAAYSQKQLNDVKNSTCQTAMLFKSLARSIYAIERIFRIKIGDDVKTNILEKFKAFNSLTKSLYTDLVSIETLKAMLYIVKRSGRNISDTEIGIEELQKTYNAIKPKIASMVNYYSEMHKDYFHFLKKNLNFMDGDAVTFDTE
ncbi:P4a precursor [Eptesipox virus]|uniref:P4a n=1 Tax=Eptesipox virus TaxID=1329402 RepID=R4JS96_9POXV|nr:P4a precursor [Eptesipox virus]AGK89945.1 virion core protein P4a [Eptesipox virus]ASK51307.1 P4a precursor [Eptesipox virus]